MPKAIRLVRGSLQATAGQRQGERWCQPRSVCGSTHTCRCSGCARWRMISVAMLGGTVRKSHRRLQPASAGCRYKILLSALLHTNWSCFWPESPSCPKPLLPRYYSYAHVILTILVSHLNRLHPREHCCTQEAQLTCQTKATHTQCRLQSQDIFADWQPLLAHSNEGGGAASACCAGMRRQHVKYIGLAPTVMWCEPPRRLFCGHRVLHDNAADCFGISAWIHACG